MSHAFKGVVTPILTPFEADGRIAADLYVAHAKWLLAQGAHYISPFGTTGEALSVSLTARKAAVEALIAGGVPAEKLIPGTGLCAVEETAELSGHALDAGCAGVMTLPSFFYKAASEDGHLRYFDELIRRVDDDRLKIVLYHIPSHSGVPITPALAARLNAAHPDAIVGYKDSGGDWENTAAVIAAAPALAVFPGSEAFLSQGLAAGGAGCISATVNINAAAIRAVYDGGGDDAAMKAFRATVQKAGLILSMKALLAVRLDEPRWLNALPPHLDATREQGEALIAALGPAVDHIGVRAAA